MVEVYVTLIINGRRTIDKVPENIRPKVVETLIERGYDTEGNKLDSVS